MATKCTLKTCTFSRETKSHSVKQNYESSLRTRVLVSGTCKVQPQIYTRDPRPYVYHPAPCNGVVSHGAQFRGFGVSADPTQVRANAKQMSSQSSNATRCFTCVCLHAQTAVHAGTCNILA